MPWAGLHGTPPDLGDLDPLPLVADPYPVAAEPGTAPMDFVLQQSFPNPFTATTTIPYTLGKTGPVRVDVFDLAGCPRGPTSTVSPRRRAHAPGR